MKKYSIYLVLLFALVGIIQSSYSQETRVSGTIKIHPWISLPAVISTDIKGGMQSLGSLDLTATPVTILNTTVPAFNRQTGMIVSVLDTHNNGNQTRYFEYLGTDNWREVFVINTWEPDHNYVVGDYVAYQQNYYVANTSFRSDATNFAADAAKWNNAGGKDGKYSVSELTMDTKALSKVAVSGTSVTADDLDKTITTAGYVAALTGGLVNINTNRPITLSGTNVSGLNLGNGKTMAQFLEAFFFPAVAATPPTSTLTTTTTTFPYSTWKNWGNPPSGNVDFAWSVTNLSFTDNTDDKAITSIKLKSGTTELANVTPTGGNQSGNFSGIPFANTVLDAKTTFNKTYTLEVVDAQPQTVSKNITLTMSAAVQLTYDAPTVATTLYEYKNTDESVNVSWNITPNDETVTAISVDGASAGSTASTGTTAVTFKTIANGGTVSKTYPLIVTGNIYGAGASKNTPTVSWTNRLYRGTITSSVPPSDGSFTFTDDQVKALSSENKLGGNWKDSGGYNFVCGAGGQYVCFAYPDDAAAPVVQYYDSNFNSWMTYSAADVTVINRPNFRNQYGYTGTNYKLVFINVQYINATVKIRLQ